MDSELPEELRLLKRTVREFVDWGLIPIEMKSMDRSVLKPKVLASLEANAKELELWMFSVPEEYGVCGLDHLGLVVGEFGLR